MVDAKVLEEVVSYGVSLHYFLKMKSKLDVLISSYSSSPALLEPLFGNDSFLLATGSLNVVGMS